MTTDQQARLLMSLIKRGLPLGTAAAKAGMTTQIYARANLEMKRTALEKVDHAATFPDMPSWKQDSTLLEWLSAL